MLTREQIDNIKLHYFGREGDQSADGLSITDVRKLCDMALRALPSPEAVRGWVPNPDRDALCRPAVKHYLNMLDRQILRCDQGAYPDYYRAPFEREAEKYHKLLADIDENLDRHNKSAPASGAAKGE